MWPFKIKTEEQKEVKKLLKPFKKIKGYNELTVEELSNGKGDDE